jgi:hypothetical protein
MNVSTETPPKTKARTGNLSAARSLSSKVLVLTVIFVMIAEVLIFVPSVANFRMRWLQDRLNTAAVAAVVLANTPQEGLSRAMQDDVLMATGAKRRRRDCLQSKKCRLKSTITSTLLKPACCQLSVASGTL